MQIRTRATLCQDQTDDEIVDTQSFELQGSQACQIAICQGTYVASLPAASWASGHRLRSQQNLGRVKVQVSDQCAGIFLTIFVLEAVLLQAGVFLSTGMSTETAQQKQ